MLVLIITYLIEYFFVRKLIRKAFGVENDRNQSVFLNLISTFYENVAILGHFIDIRLVEIEQDKVELIDTSKWIQDEIEWINNKIKDKKQFILYLYGGEIQENQKIAENIFNFCLRFPDNQTLSEKTKEMAVFKVNFENNWFNFIETIRKAVIIIKDENSDIKIENIEKAVNKKKFIVETRNIDNVKITKEMVIFIK